MRFDHLNDKAFRIERGKLYLLIAESFKLVFLFFNNLLYDEEYCQNSVSFLSEVESMRMVLC